MEAVQRKSCGPKRRAPRPMTSSMRRQPSTPVLAPKNSKLLQMVSLFVLMCWASGFSLGPSFHFGGRIPAAQRNKDTSLTRLQIYAPPGSGYQSREDEESVLPDTYEPMMEYPGTMRPGRTPENMPFQDLPIGDNDPDPVPWPHFQQIEWHHRWEPPHEHPIPMEEFIEQQGRWATPEMEAAMRAGFRRDVRERREAEEADKRDTIITDDDDDDGQDLPVALGDGIFGQLGSSADQAATAAATSPDRAEEDDGEDEGEDVDDGLDDFLLDLGLDAEFEDDSGDDQESTGTKEDDVESEGGISMKTSGGGVTASINVEDDSDLDLGFDDDDELESDTVPLEDFGDDNDTLDMEDIFDEGGFDYDDGDFDGGDVW